MMTAFNAALVWLILGNLAGMLPSKRNHWPTAYVLIATGLPILAWLWVENGPLLALIFIAAGASVLRWPIFYAWRWLQRQVRGGEPE